MVERDEELDPEGRLEHEPDLGTGADLGQAADVVDVEQELAQVAEEEGEDEEYEDARQFGLATR